MASRKRARLAEIRAYTEERGVELIDEAHFEVLHSQLAPIGERELRKLLRESAVKLAPVVEGVRQENFDELQRTLTALASEYVWSAGNRERERLLRRLVITAKEHARFAGRRSRDASKRADKEEMAEWMLLWLENPAIFPQWAQLRRRQGPATRNCTPVATHANLIK